MDNLEPITREEMLLDGEDLTPITREEMFIKRIYDKTQVVPEPITRHEMFLKKAGEGGGGDITIEQLNVTQNGIYSESGKAYSPVVVNVPAPPIPENAYLLNDLSDLPADIASFTDGTDLPMASLKVAVTPYQDLHGYDGPWAGGAGKNKLNNTATSTTRNGITFTVNTNGSVTVSGTATAIATLELGSLSVRQGETYTISGSISAYDSTQSQLFCRSEVAFPSGNRLQSYSGLSKTATALADETITTVLYVYEGTSVNGTFYPQIELGSTATTYTPYSNICPISGWDEANVSVSGVNVWDEEWESGKYSLDNGSKIVDASTIRSKNYINVKPNIVIYSKMSSLSSSGAIAFWYDKNKTFIRWEYCGNKSLTVPSNAYYMTFYCGSSYGTTYNNDISINYPSTDTSYHAYNGATYTIDLDGTRYGGTLDATDGTFLDMIDHIASYNGEELPPAWISDRDVYAVGTTPTIGAEVVYPRATPITVQLSPTQVKSLEGENNIFANCGQITEVKYFKKA